MTVDAQLVKTLRAKTSAGVMQCKQALTEAGGDLEAAIEIIRKQGAIAAQKKSARESKEGMVIAGLSDEDEFGVLVEINCETDFVAMGARFKAFAQAVCQTAISHRCEHLDALMNSAIVDGDHTVEQARQAMVTEIGENIQVSRLHAMGGEPGTIAHYAHGVRIAVLVQMAPANTAVAKEVAMHIAAMKPIALDEAHIPSDLLSKERDIFKAQVIESGKPAEMADKIVEGKIKKFLRESTLIQQAFIKDQDQSVGSYVSSKKTAIVSFLRLELGEDSQQ